MNISHSKNDFIVIDLKCFFERDSFIQSQLIMLTSSSYKRKINLYINLFCYSYLTIA